MWALRDSTVHTGAIQANCGLCFLLILRVSSCKEKSRLTGPPSCAFCATNELKLSGLLLSDKKLRNAVITGLYVFCHEVSLKSKQTMCSILKPHSYPSLTTRGMNKERADDVKREILNVLRLNQHLNFFNQESRQPTPVPTVQTPYLT